eukprot:GEMP01044764.1.p1 GENE.GEMP01044764.1~~GEMP01044764.1.p1  ORF type:complete len:390 (+),score=122.36 GEMP01044764.1:75-1244(+)
MATYRLSAVEAFRAQVLLEDSLKKLEFLTSISSSANVHRDELTQFMGDEISRIIHEQRDLEKQYESLIAVRGTLKGLCNKAKFKEVQTQIQEVAHKLRESNKSLCRNLKENPNVQGNLLKMQQERSRVQELLEDTKGELIELSFSGLWTKVDNERRSQELLNEVKKKEHEASMTVKVLEAELQREYQDHEKETKQSNQEIKDLKEELQKSKTISKIEVAFEEKRLKARLNADARMFAQKEKIMQETFADLEQTNHLENDVHTHCGLFLQQKIEMLNDHKQNWQERYDREKKEREDELNSLREKRGNGFEQLTELQKRMDEEKMKQRIMEEEHKNLAFIEKQRQEQENRIEEAINFLQREGRLYIEKVRISAASKKGGKKKGGKKKGKKK